MKHSWPDMVVSCATGCFTMSLIPGLLDSHTHVHWVMSTMTAIAELAMIPAFWVKKMPWSAITASTTMLGWTAMAVFRS